MTLVASDSGSADRAPSEERTGYELVCADPEARALLAGWLDGTRFAWPGRFKLTVSVGDHCPFAPDDRPLLSQPTVSIQAGPPSGTVRIEWALAPASAVVHPTLPEAELWLSPGAIVRIPDAERTFLLVVLVFLLRRLGWFHVHSAALRDPRGRGWLIAGDSNTGKSTTTALLATRGWQVGTDDIGFLARRDDHVAVMGACSLIALRSGARDLMGTRSGTELTRRDKRGFSPEDLGSSWVREVIPEIIVFPRIGERTGVAPSLPRKALSSLVKWSLWVLYEPAFADEHLQALSRLASQSRCFELTLGPDLFAHPDLLGELVP